MNSKIKRALVADWEKLIRTFIRPENEATRVTLVKYMEQILFGLHEFLKENVGITEEISIRELSEDFRETHINTLPEKKLADVITDLIEDIAPHAVNVTSPYFIGHMTSAIPFFMVHLKTIVAALNQNVVKLETSKVVSVIEKQLIAKLHRIIFRKDEAFYRQHVQNTHTMLGSFAENGTMANLTALWVARNTLLKPKAGFDGIEKDGINAAYRAYDIDRCVVLVSKRGHYSLRKACGILGIGNNNVIAVDVDENSRIRTDRVERTVQEIGRDRRSRILAIVGIAGATETGTIDPLKELAGICRENQIHFHVDAAWGGPTLLSEKYSYLLEGIDEADSVSIDGHKQFYMPMSCGMVYFNDPYILDAIVYHSNYVNRPGSLDLGQKTLSGSREANSLILDSALKIMGTKGYALLIEHGIETARRFSKEIKSRSCFEVVTEPELNILTYRICPDLHKKALRDSTFEKRKEINRKLNEVNTDVQRLQREAGRSFVSRTTLHFPGNGEDAVVVLRCVIMNPMTHIGILKDILDEQESLFQQHFDKNLQKPCDSSGRIFG